MKYYNFKKGVYLVEGKVNGCIYDLNNQKLYAINKDLKDCLLELFKNSRLIDKELKTVIEQLIGFELIELNNTKEELRSIKEIADNKKKIDFAWIKVIDKCNLICSHCFEEASPNCSGEMELNDFKKVVQELVQNNIKKVQLYGGEPLLLKDKLVEMIEHSRKYFDIFEIFTNATLINDYWIEVFKKYRPKVRLSLHSYNRENHDKVTNVKGSYDKVFNAINLLNRNNISHSIAMILMKDIDVGEKKFECNIRTDIVRMSGRADINLLDKKLLSKKIITKEYFAKPIDINQLRLCVVKHNCFGKKIYIDTNLNVYPCVTEKRFMHGNLKNNSLANVLKDEIIYLNKDKIHVCNKCEYRYACFDCRPDSWECNKLDKPWFCTYDPIKGEWHEESSFIEKFNLT